VMAASSSPLSICSYNMHGFNTGLPFLKQLCDGNDIIFLQEHWLQDSQLTDFNAVDSRFLAYGKSSMDKCVASGFLRGRPFGGVAVMWCKELSTAISHCESDADGRIVMLKIDHGDLKLVVFGVCFPCNDHSSIYVNSVI